MSGRTDLNRRPLPWQGQSGDGADGAEVQGSESTEGERAASRHRGARSAAERTQFVPPVSPRSAGALRVLDGLPERLLTAREVADSLGVCRATVYALCERGELAHVRIAHAIRVSRLDLDAFVASKRKGGRP